MTTEAAGGTAIIITHDSGSDTINTLSNSNTVIVNNGSSLSISSGGTNTGILQAGGASPGTLNLNGGTFTNTGGVLDADVGGVIVLNGVSVAGGSLNSGGTGTGTFVPVASGNNFLNGVTLNGTLDLATSQGVERVTGGLTLNGAINVDSNSILSFEGDQTINGTGTITLGAAGSSNRIDIGTGNLTLGSGILIHGQNGTIGNQDWSGGGSTLTNNGVISADVSGGTINLRVNGLTTNNGTLSALNGGALWLSNGVTNGAGGQINAGAGSQVVQNGVAVTGGTINTTGTGTFVPVASGNNFLNGVTLNGTLDLASSQGIERVTGGLTLQPGSAINVNSNSILSFEGDQAINGTGTITLGAAGSSNRIDIGTGNLTLGSGILIHGQNGTIGNQDYAGGGSTLTNNGVISADVSLGTINLRVNGPTTNNGTLNALNGGTLVLSSPVTNGAGSQINAIGAGSQVVQNGIALSGVTTINVSGGGAFIPTNSGNNFLNGVTLNGTLDLASSNGIERVTGGLTLNGTINVNNNSILSFEGGGMVGSTGTGTITLGNTGSSNRIDIGTGDLTLGSGILIHGQNGTIGRQDFAGGGSTLTNNGVISADVAGGTITLQVSGPTTNNNTLSALNGGALWLSNGVTNAGSGHIDAIGAGSQVVQNAVTVSGGTINATGGGAFIPTNNGNNFLTGVTLNGAIDLASSTAIERVTGGLTLQPGSAINVDSNSILSFEGGGAIGGTGTITLGATGSSNRIDIGTGDLTLGTGILIHGQNGTIGRQDFAGGGSTLTNNGVISVDVAGGTITLQVNGLTTNNNTLSALNNGTLVLNSPVTNGGSGHIDAIGAGSQVVQNAVTVSGGTINATGGGAFIPTNNGNNFLTGVTLNGAIDLASSTAIERVTGGLTLQPGSAINVNSNSILSFEDTNQTIGGTGTITFGATGSSNRIDIGTGNLIVGPGILIHGQNGTIGRQDFAGGGSTLTNNGVISADVSGGLISLTVNGLTTNNGTLSAQNNGTLALNSPVQNNGTVSALSNSAVYVNSGYTQTAGGFTVVDGSLHAPNLGISGGILSGSGTVFGNVTISGTGTVHPGNSPGVLTVSGNYTSTSTGTLAIDILNVTALAKAGTDFSQLQVTGTATLGGTVLVNLLPGAVVVAGQEVDILRSAGLSGTFASLTGAYASDFTPQYTLTDVFLEANKSFTTAPVPLPPSLLLLAPGLAGLVGRRWLARRKKQGLPAPGVAE